MSVDGWGSEELAAALQQAIDYAYANGVVVVASAADEAGRIRYGPPRKLKLPSALTVREPPPPRLAVAPAALSVTDPPRSPAPKERWTRSSPTP